MSSLKQYFPQILLSIIIGLLVPSVLSRIFQWSFNTPPSEPLMMQRSIVLLFTFIGALVAIGIHHKVLRLLQKQNNESVHRALLWIGSTLGGLFAVWNLATFTRLYHTSIPFLFLTVLTGIFVILGYRITWWMIKRETTSKVGVFISRGIFLGFLLGALTGMLYGILFFLLVPYESLSITLGVLLTRMLLSSFIGIAVGPLVGECFGAFIAKTFEVNGENRLFGGFVGMVSGLSVLWIIAPSSWTMIERPPLTMMQMSQIIITLTVFGYYFAWFLDIVRHSLREIAAGKHQS